jgi:hypothetical protein
VSCACSKELPRPSGEIATQLSGRPQVSVMIPFGSRRSTGITPVGGRGSPLAVVTRSGLGVVHVLPSSLERLV